MLVVVVVYLKRVIKNERKFGKQKKAERNCEIECSSIESFLNFVQLEKNDEQQQTTKFH